MSYTGIAVIESNWWRKSNVSVRSLFELVANIACANPNAYHYEMANCEHALKESIARIASYSECKYLCLAMHGGFGGLSLLNGECLTRSELRNALCRIVRKKGSRLSGVYMASCLFGTNKIAEFLFEKDIGVKWIAGYTKEIDWINASAMDLLFFNELLNQNVNSDVAAIEQTAAKIRAIAPGLIDVLGFGIYCRKRGGGIKNLLTATPSVRQIE